MARFIKEGDTEASVRQRLFNWGQMRRAKIVQRTKGPVGLLWKLSEADAKVYLRMLEEEIARWSAQIDAEVTELGLKAE